MTDDASPPSPALEKWWRRHQRSSLRLAALLVSQREKFGPYIDMLYPLDQIYAPWLWPEKDLKFLPPQLIESALARKKALEKACEDLKSEGLSEMIPKDLFLRAHHAAASRAFAGEAPLNMQNVLLIFENFTSKFVKVLSFQMVTLMLLSSEGRSVLEFDDLCELLKRLVFIFSLAGRSSCQSQHSSGCGRAVHLGDLAATGSRFSGGTVSPSQFLQAAGTAAAVGLASLLLHVLNFQETAGESAGFSFTKTIF